MTWKKHIQQVWILWNGNVGNLISCGQLFQVLGDVSLIQRPWTLTTVPQTEASSNVTNSQWMLGSSHLLCRNAQSVHSCTWVMRVSGDIKPSNKNVDGYWGHLFSSVLTKLIGHWLTVGLLAGIRRSHLLLAQISWHRYDVWKMVWWKMLWHHFIWPCSLGYVMLGFLQLFASTTSGL